jgi:RNA polymerase sigma-70 factor (ECF subfamily)
MDPMCAEAALVLAGPIVDDDEREPRVARADVRGDARAPGQGDARGAAHVDVPPLTEVYDRHVAMVWRTLRALGVDEAALDDAVQDVFIVVHRRLADFEGRSALSTWIYGIARRVASQYRRRRRVDGDPTRLAREVEPGPSPRDAAERRQAARLVMELLAELDPEKREVFVLMELEQLAAPVVAELVGVPVNTVYSRLRLARQRFEAALARRRGEDGP